MQSLHSPEVTFAISRPVKYLTIVPKLTASGMRQSSLLMIEVNQTLSVNLSPKVIQIRIT